MLSQVYGQIYSLDTRLEYLLGGLNWESYKKLLHRAIVGDRRPGECGVLEIDPMHQKDLAGLPAHEAVAGHQDGFDH